LLRTARPVRTAAIVAAAAGAFALSACSPTTTINPYAPSDGARVDLTDHLRGANLLVVAGEQGGPGTLEGALVNRTAEDQSFTLTIEGSAPVRIDVAPAQTVYLGTEQGEQVRLDAVAAAPGAFLPATLEVGSESKDFQIPVLDGSLPEYASAVPTAS
jgi:hypothetical protein